MIISVISLQNCKGYIAVVFRSPSQENIEFENFLPNFDELLSKAATSNSLFTIMLDYFNARSLSWWNDETNAEGSLASIFLFFSFSNMYNIKPHYN